PVILPDAFSVRIRMTVSDSPFAGLVRAVATAAILLLVWYAGVRIFAPAPFILPGPGEVFATLVEDGRYLSGHALVTLSEIALGLLIGTLLGVVMAVLV